jgi:glycosyltransferase involved in cell wall biosynthesis
MEKVLLLSHAFNMDGRAASLTITDKLPVFADRGWQPVVLSGILGKKDPVYEHHQLMCWGPSGLRFDFRHWFALRFGRGPLYKIITGLVSLLLLPAIVLEKLFFGWSSQWSWTFPAVLHGWLRIRKGDIAMIFSTGGGWSAHWAGWWLKKLTGKPWIVEVHDPLVDRYDYDDDGAKPRRQRDARMRQRLEKLICRDADGAWWFTEAALANARQRNPVLGTRGFWVLPGAHPPVIREVYQKGPVLRIGHFGSLAGTRSLRGFIKALKVFVDRHPEARGQVILDVYGSQLDRPSKSLIEHEKLQDLVHANGRLEFDPATGRSGRERVLVEMQTVDVLLLLHGNTPFCEEYIPSKLYDYLWAFRPILAIVHRNPQLEHLVKQYEGWCVTEKDHEALVESLGQIWTAWRDNALPAPRHTPIDVEQAVDNILRHVSEVGILSHSSATKPSAERALSTT